MTPEETAAFMAESKRLADQLNCQYAYVIHATERNRELIGDEAAVGDQAEALTWQLDNLRDAQELNEQTAATDHLWVRVESQTA